MSKQGNRLYAFGDFLLDPQDRLLKHQGRPVQLSPKPFDVLVLLVERAGKVVSKEEFFARIWQDEFVEEGSLTVYISALRKALGEGRGGREFIETVPKSGYRFVAEVREVGGLARAAGPEEEAARPEAAAETDATPPAFPDQTAAEDEGVAALPPVADTSGPPAVEAAAVPRPRPPARPRARLVTALVTLGVVAAVAAGLFLAYRRPRASGVTGQRERLTKAGRAECAAVSPDGQFVAYALEEAGQQSLYVRRTTSAVNTVRVVGPGALEFVGVAFSPDGEFVYYAVKPADEVIASLYSTPALGGQPPRKILTDIDSAPAFAPDGRRFAFLRIAGDGSHESLRVANSDGTDERVLYERRMPEFIPSRAEFAWSPDGQVIAVPGGTYAGERRSRVYAVSAQDGSAAPLSEETWAELGQAAWLPDGSGLLLTARKDESDEVKQLWLVPRGGEPATRLTDDYEDYNAVSMTADGAHLVTLVGGRRASLWVAEAGSANATARQITFGHDDGYGLAFAPDGRIVYGSNEGGNPDLFSVGADGSDKRQLTGDPHADTDPCVSPGGDFVAYTQTRAGGKQLWRVGLDGRGRRRLTEGANEVTPACGPDGFVYYFTFATGTGTLSRVPAGGGAVQVLTDGPPARFPAVSPDGGRVATAYREAGGTVNKIAVWNLADSSAPERVFEPARGARSPGPLRWTRDGRTLAYIVTRRGVSNVWAQPVAGGEPRQLTDFTAEKIYHFDFSPDGRGLAAARGDSEVSVLLWKNFRGQ